MKNLSKHILRGINILFLYNVTGTSYGVLVGLLLLSIQETIGTFLPVFNSIKWYGFIVFGILIFNIKPLIKHKYEDPSIETKMKYAREICKEANFSEKEVKMVYRKLINSILEESYVKNNNDNSAIE